MHRIKLVEDAAGGKLSRYGAQAQPTALERVALLRRGPRGDKLAGSAWLGPRVEPFAMVLAGASRSLAGGIFRRLALVPDACSWASLRLDWASLRLGWTSLRLDERGSLEQAQRIFLRLRCINERQRE